MNATHSTSATPNQFAQSQTAELQALRHRELKELLTAQYLTSQELLWAETFHDTVKDSAWLKQQSFHPGRFAAGYPLLYVLYRILDEVRPHSILELGMGESTRLIAQYVKAATKKSSATKDPSTVTHSVVESDESWAAFFQSSCSLSRHSKVHHLEAALERTNLEGTTATVRRYLGFEEEFKDRHFDLIVIDGPYGEDMRDYSRVDVLTLLPSLISPERFVILLDDCNRPGEQRTLQAMEAVLQRAGIDTVTGFYQGLKTTAVLASASLKFVATL